MIFERVKSEGLAHLSYFVGSEDEAVVIDPRRDCQVYVDFAQREGMKVTRIFETHRNEDYVIGSLELASLADARIYHGPGLDFRYGEALADGQEFSFGKLRLTAVHTPGHTVESMTYALTDTEVGDKPFMAFTGDSLFVGDVGRTDLYGPNETQRMSEALYNSITNKILTLGEGVIICPAHGAGSVCGGAIGEKEQSTIRFEREHNPLLQKSKKDFIQYKMAEHLEIPPYFSKMSELNLRGPPLLRNLTRPTPLTPEEFRARIDAGAVVVDARSPPSFGGANIGGSYSIMLDILPSFAGWVLPYETPILLVLEDRQHLDAAVRYLVRVGFDWMAGYLASGIEAWYDAALPVGRIGLLSVQELKTKLGGGERLTVLDVRREDEWDKGHVKEATHIYVGNLPQRYREIPRDCPVAVLCSVGNRASLGASILRLKGCKEVYNVLGGMEAWVSAGYDVVK